MGNRIYEVKRDRFHLLDPQLYLLQGMIPHEYRVEAFADRQKLDVQLEEWKNQSALERFTEEELAEGQMVTVTVQLPAHLDGYHILRVYAVKKQEKMLWFTVRCRELLERQGRPQYYIEEENMSPDAPICSLRGWVAADQPVSIGVFDSQKKKILCRIQRLDRADVAEMFKEHPIEKKAGFYIEMSQPRTPKVYLVMKTKDSRSIYPIGMTKFSGTCKKVRKYQKKGMDYLRNYGIKALTQKIMYKIRSVKNRPMEYGKWLTAHLPTETELQKQRQTRFPRMPKISIVVPLYKTIPEYLDQLVQSILAQTYGNWELCLSDGSGESSPLTEQLKRYMAQDPRIRVVFQKSQLHISENTNAAIRIATGEYIAFADHDDMLEPHALFACVKALNENPGTEVLYSDEDKMTADGNKYFQPHFKPDFNPDLLCSVNYICHLFVVKREIIDRVGMLRHEFDGAQDYDFIFRCTESTDRIFHIPEILYHWRSHESSTAENPESKKYAFEAGKRAVEAHYERMGIRAEVSMGEYAGLYRTKYIRSEDPLVSILIPNKDHVQDLERCISSIEEKSTYSNYEYIIIENNSEKEETFLYYEELKKKNPKVKVVVWDGIFNYSAINNFGAAHASGEYLLLLNNDTEIINGDCIEEMLGYGMREDVGIVGARLYYADDTIQHAGVVIGFGGIAGHCFVQQPRSATGYFHRIICAQDYSAVTAACMMVRKSVFDEVGGLTEELQVAFNDIDFCLKVRKKGYLVVYNPYAELYHYESKSRGPEDTPEKVARFNREISIMEKRWPEVFAKGDPYYNKNLTLDSQDFSLSRK